VANRLNHHHKRIIDEPVLVQFLMNDARASILWFFVRIWLGWQWLDTASHKIGVLAWTETGEALRTYWEHAIMTPETGGQPISSDWYRSFIQLLLDVEAYTWFAKLVAYGELFVGIALIIGAFVGLAAFLGGVMNWSFLITGSTSSNPLLFIATVGLILAWKTAGYIGFDFFFLPWLTTPRTHKATDEMNSSSLEPVSVTASN